MKQPSPAGPGHGQRLPQLPDRPPCAQPMSAPCVGPEGPAAHLLAGTRLHRPQATLVLRPGSALPAGPQWSSPSLSLLPAGPSDSPKPPGVAQACTATLGPSAAEPTSRARREPLCPLPSLPRCREVPGHVCSGPRVHGLGNVGQSAADRLWGGPLAPPSRLTPPSGTCVSGTPAPSRLGPFRF